MDIWRGALLSAGIIVHCAALCDIVAFNMIEDTSHLFRMEAFFAISGFFAALTIGKSAPGPWIKRRLIMLLVPLIFGLVVAVPLSHLLIEKLSTMHGFMDGYLPWQPGDWHMHMWFLISLSIYAPLTIALQSKENLLASLGRVAEKTPLGMTVLIWGAGAAASLAVWGASKALTAIGLQPIVFLLRQTVYFSIFYALGYAAFRIEAVRKFLLAPPKLVYAVALLMAVIDLASVALVTDGKLRMLIFFVARPIVGFAGTSLVFRSAFALRKCYKWQTDLSSASYTIYLLHVPVILTLLWVLYPTGLSPWAAMAIIAPVTLLTLYYLHLLVVRRSSILLFLLNGRQKPAARPMRVAPLDPTNGSVPPTRS